VGVNTHFVRITFIVLGANCCEWWLYATWFDPFHIILFSFPVIFYPPEFLLCYIWFPVPVIGRIRLKGFVTGSGLLPPTTRLHLHLRMYFRHLCTRKIHVYLFSLQSEACLCFFCFCWVFCFCLLLILEILTFCCSYFRAEVKVDPRHSKCTGKPDFFFFLITHDVHFIFDSNMQEKEQ
jgi:hypothetical protein